MRRLQAAMAAGALLLFAMLSPAQQPAPVAPCAYVQCALGIAPAWNGLAVVRGAEEARVANLNFFLARPITTAFSGDSARAAADRAFVVRRRASLLTDLGGLLLVAGAATSAGDGRFTGTPRAVTLAGAALFAASVPLQFSADGWLSRAVWWHNAAYAR